MGHCQGGERCPLGAAASMAMAPHAILGALGHISIELSRIRQSSEVSVQGTVSTQLQEAANLQ